MKSIQFTRVSRSAFTLMEMLVVIAILGLLIGTVAVSTRGIMARSKISNAKQRLAVIENALEEYSGFNEGRYPTEVEGLASLKDNENEEDNYLEKSTKDPWGTEIQYLVPGPKNEPYELICAGPDREFETDDDLSNLDVE